jgi:cell division protein FtsL
MSTLNDLRPTYVLRKYSTTLLLAALLDRAMDRDQLEIDRLELCIENIEKRNEGRIKERAVLRAKLEQENNEKKGTK